MLLTPLAGQRRRGMDGGKKFSWWGRLRGGGSGPRVEHNSTPFNFLKLRAAGNQMQLVRFQWKWARWLVPRRFLMMLAWACHVGPWTCNLHTHEISPPPFFSKGGSFVRLASSGAPGHSVPRLTLLLSSRPISLESWRSQLSPCVISLGCQNDKFVNKMCLSWGYVLKQTPIKR
jgi:hypothetical protein